MAKNLGDLFIWFSM